MHGDLLVRGGVYYLLLVMGRWLEEVPRVRIQAPISGREARMIKQSQTLERILTLMHEHGAILIFNYVVVGYADSYSAVTQIYLKKDGVMTKLSNPVEYGPFEEDLKGVDDPLSLALIEAAKRGGSLYEQHASDYPGCRSFNVYFGSVQYRQAERERQRQKDDIRYAALTSPKTTDDEWRQYMAALFDDQEGVEW